MAKSRRSSGAATTKDASTVMSDTAGTIRTITLDRLIADSQIQCRERIDDLVVNEYAEAMQRGEKFAPIVGFDDGSGKILIVDGFHRHAAAEMAGLKQLEIEVCQGNRRDALLYAAGANLAHGLRRTTADKRRAVSRLLRDPEWGQWSDAEIGRRCGVSDRMVATIRNSQPESFGLTRRKFVSKHGTVGHRSVRTTRKAQTPTIEQDEMLAEEGPAPVAPSGAPSASEQLSGFDDWPADDAATAGDADDAERTVIRAAEAAEAVAALGEALATVRPDVMERFRCAVGRVAELRRQVVSAAAEHRAADGQPVPAGG